MDTNVRAIQVTRDADFVNFGIVIDDDMHIFQVNFLKNPHNWGVTVVDPDGNTTTKLSKNGWGIEEFTIEYMGRNIVMDVTDNDDNGMYEIYYL